MKNTIAEVSSSVDELSRRTELTEERTRKHAHRTELTSSDNRERAGRAREGSRAQGPVGLQQKL